MSRLDGEFSSFILLLTLTLHFVRVRCAGWVAISLSFHKEMAKEKEPKGLEPFGNP